MNEEKEQTTDNRKDIQQQQELVDGWNYMLGELTEACRIVSNLQEACRRHNLGGGRADELLIAELDRLKSIENSTSIRFSDHSRNCGEAQICEFHVDNIRHTGELMYIKSGKDDDSVAKLYLKNVKPVPEVPW